MTEKVLHIVFTPSGAGSLRQALKAIGRNEQVVALFDDLSFGPINSSDPSIRATWVEDELGWTDWNEVVSQTEPFWAAALSPDYRKIAWVSRRSAMEYSGFLDWVWRLGDAPCEVIDLTDTQVFRYPEHGPPKSLAASLGLIPHYQIVDSDLFGRTEILEKQHRNDYQSLWQRLRIENAPLRVIDGGTLVSAPITFFDSLLMPHVTDDWRKVALIVGHALYSQTGDCISQTNDLVLAARVRALVEAGQLELQGPPALEIHLSEVRLPKRKTP